ncbi:hypothetical protein PoB_002784200 [Plakobranchus ocellatus]|uniref:Uncharacterized protein n=1 Tax=Plakobranchus ocellatus TaxID=259542 RepID=A0AAV4A381_9GAST|nr:hypothetical protein PoB_002784200 [Plakobranchus ocellatus]
MSCFCRNVRHSWSSTYCVRQVGKGAESVPYVVQMRRNGHWTSRRVGCDDTGRYSIGEGQGCHEFGSKHVAHVPLASHAVGARPGSGA